MSAVPTPHRPIVVRSSSSSTPGWLLAVAGFALAQVGLLALTIGGVEADLLHGDGTPPLWQPVALVGGLVILGAGGLLIARARRLAPHCPSCTCDRDHVHEDAT